jgi:hypothetical protein
MTALDSWHWWECCAGVLPAWGRSAAGSNRPPLALCKRANGHSLDLRIGLGIVLPQERKRF